ncbi:MAG: YggT family protein [Cyanobacteria bacterium NC_groundwater_1444_Ag_S-0.65um_54_12]|nr:YggT family protein [Cyanobacteria bacterium NC_groundwater_1444_Ag_S-0.65um_54_12]
MIEIVRQLLFTALQVWSFLLLAWVLLSWIPGIDRYHPLVRGISGMVEPTIRPFRRLLPNLGPFDISPILAIACYQVLWKLLDAFLFKLGGG